VDRGGGKGTNETGLGHTKVGPGDIGGLGFNPASHENAGKASEGEVGACEGKLRKKETGKRRLRLQVGGRRKKNNTRNGAINDKSGRLSIRGLRRFFNRIKRNLSEISRITLTYCLK